MQITLNQKEIEKAIVDFVCGQGIPIAGRNVKIQLITGSDIKAAIEITGSGLSLDTTNTTHAGCCSNAFPDQQTQCTPIKEEKPVIADTTEEVDREKLKKQLDALGIEYAPKAHTATLVSLLEEAQAAQAKTGTPLFGANEETAVTNEPAKPAEVVTETSSMFGSAVTTQAPAEEPPPFYVEPAAPQQVTEEELDEKPLFGV